MLDQGKMDYDGDVESAIQHDIFTGFYVGRSREFLHGYVTIAAGDQLIRRSIAIGGGDCLKT